MVDYAADAVAPPRLSSKDPNDDLDYKFDWSPELDSVGDAIDSYTITVPEGITKHDESVDGHEVTVWLSGGTHGRNYTVTCAIITASTPPRSMEKSFVLPVRNS